MLRSTFSSSLVSPMRGLLLPSGAEQFKSKWFHSFQTFNRFASFKWFNVTERSIRSRRFKSFKPAMSLTSFSRSKRLSPHDNRARGA